MGTCSIWLPRRWTALILHDTSTCKLYHLQEMDDAGTRADSGFGKMGCRSNNLHYRSGCILLPASTLPPFPPPPPLLDRQTLPWEQSWALQVTESGKNFLTIPTLSTSLLSPPCLVAHLVPSLLIPPLPPPPLATDDMYPWLPWGLEELQSHSYPFLARLCQKHSSARDSGGSRWVLPLCAYSWAGREQLEGGNQAGRKTHPPPPLPILSQAVQPSWIWAYALWSSPTPGAARGRRNSSNGRKGKGRIGGEGKCH